MATRDYHQQISYENVQDVLEYAHKKKLDIDIIEGTLNDTYIIHAGKTITINRTKPREYIILYPKFLNSWANTFHLLQTDKESTVAEFSQA